MRTKPLELSLYVAGAGAFGVFLRWLENQLAFDEADLAKPSAFHVMVIVFLVVCGLLLVIAIFWPIRWFMSVDFPTLGRPTMTAYPDLNI